MTVSLRLSARRRTPILALKLQCMACLSIGACAPGLSMQETSVCRAAGHNRPEARLTYLQELVSSADSDYVTTRQGLGLTRMKSSDVRLVTRQEDCQRAVTALNTVRQEPGVLREVWLCALGTAGYAVDDPGLDVGFADRVLYFFDRSFNYKVTISGF